METRFVKLNSYWSVDEANLAKLHLKSEGIEADLEGETVASVAWINANAIGGVKLLVKDLDVDRARKILRMNSETHASVQHQSELSNAIPADDGSGRTELTDEGDEASLTPTAFSRLRNRKRLLIGLFLLCPIVLIVTIKLLSAFNVYTRFGP